MNKKRSRSDTAKENDVLDRIDCMHRNLANLRPDIAVIVRDTVLQILKEHDKMKRHFEVGYR